MTTKPNANDIIGYDDSSSMHDIRATCATCEEAHPCGGPAIYRGDEWGGHECKCQYCNDDLDVELVGGV